MDLSILQKVSELMEEGRSTDDIKHELQMSGVSPENVTAAINEVVTTKAAEGESPASTQGQAPSQTPDAVSTPAMAHHEKVIQPEPGFDPNAK